MKLVESSLVPFDRLWEFDDQEAIRFGESILIAEKTSNRQSNELGTGGITDPAMLWTTKREK
ncbi:hypothetical protein OAK15_00420 [Verrucomicrobia bacterium]|nr:hypothetical protein [Verrucomicrobiota bacterium]